MSVWEETISVNPAQVAYMMLQAKRKYVIYSRGTGKSFINGTELDENIRLMPRGITSLTQATYGQTLTKTLPSTFKMLEMLGYRRFDAKTGIGDYVVCRKPPEGWLQPYEHILSYEHCITFKNGHTLYLLSQDGNSRGPNVDYNITDEALTLNKQKFDEEAAPTIRANKHVWGPKGSSPVYKHNGQTFFSSMPYTPSQKWLLEPADYYEKEKGVRLFDVWNRMVRLQLQLVEAAIAKDAPLYKELWNECVRLRRSIVPFVSRDGVLFILGSIFDNIANIGMSYIVNMYHLMDKLTFMIEILNFYIDKIDSCYYQIDERHIYYNATNDSFIRDFADNEDFNWDKLALEDDSRRDLDCDPNKPLEITPDWGSNAAFLEVGQVRYYDFVARKTSSLPIDCNINEFFVKRDDEADTMVNALIDKFCHYYRFHAKKHLVYFRDRYGDIKHAISKKTYNQVAIERLEKNGWLVEQRTHEGIEPPQHDKYLLWASVLAESDERFPIKRFNGSKCKYTLISMNNTRVMEDSLGRFTKDKRSERKKSVLPEEATHFGDAVDKRLWTKYGKLLTSRASFVDARF